MSNNASAVMLEWDIVQYADSYNVYRSADKFAAWPWAKIGDNVTATNWTDAAGTYDDANTYFYIVKAWNLAGEGGNSSMGTKVRKTFTYNDPALRANSNWISLPYELNLTSGVNLNDAKALKDDITANTPVSCSKVSWWDPAAGYETYTGFGTPFDLIPGRGYMAVTSGAATISIPSIATPGP